MRRALIACLCLLAFSPAASAAPVPEGAEWTEEYFQSVDGTTLHADVLRPKGLPKDAKTPVLLTVSPYTNHSVDKEGDFAPSQSGPSGRFLDDFVIPARVFERGYTYVIVDLRGTGGSGGCTEWGGKGERGDAKAAVEWAASQSWSNGKVGMFGKSYDGWTGLMAMAERPKGLAAVLTMEPVYSGYRYFWTNGVRIGNTFGTPAAFNLFDVYPGTPSDDPQYFVNSPPQGCYAANTPQESALDDESVAFWDERNLLPPLKGVTTPTFLTQGFLEVNTKPDGAFDVYRDLAGYKRAWFGQFDHVRGWEKKEDDFLTGRTGFLDEAIGFFDHFVRGDGPAPAGPAVAVQDSTGRYHGEDVWPPADVKRFRGKLTDGTYTDDGTNAGSGSNGGNGVWTVSQPLTARAHMAGEPILRATAASASPRANLVANLYDVDPEGKAVLVSRGATIVRSSELELTLYGQDWVFEPGHRIGVLVSGANSEWWRHLPTRAPVDVSGASIDLPFRTLEPGPALDGRITSRLENHLSTAFITAPEGGESAFELPGPLQPRPVAPAVTPPAPKGKLTVKVRRRSRGRLVVSGRAPANSFVAVTVKRKRRTIATRTVRTRSGRFTVRLKARRATSVVVRAAGLRVTRRVR